MSDILASIRQIMAQDPAPSSAATAKPAPKGVYGSPRPGMKLPTPDATRDVSMRDQAPREQPPQDQPPPREQAKPMAPTAAQVPAAPSPVAAAAPTPAAQPKADAIAPAPRTLAPLAAEQPVSLDEFLALAAPPKDVVTIPVVPAAPAEPVKPAARTESPAPSRPAVPSSGPALSDGGAPAWLFPRPQPTDDANGEVAKQPALSAAPIPQRPAGPTPSAPKVDTPTPSAPMASPAPMQNKDTASNPARAAPPAPRLLGDLGSVVPGRFDSQAEGSSRRFSAPAVEPNDRFSPVGAPPSRPTPTPPSRPETPRVVPAPDIASAFETEIPGADALRRLIADVVPPSSLAPSVPARAPAPVPNQDDIRTEIVLPVPAKAPEPVTAPEPVPAPAAPAAPEPMPIARQPELAPAPQLVEPAAPTKPSEPALSAQVSPAVPTQPTDQAAAPVSMAARTMDETVVELLRPLLRDWLNTNMPRLIEPALKAELEAMRSVVAKDKKD